MDPKFNMYFLLLGIERDAVNTFTKYISPDAAKPIPITEAMRNDIVGKNMLYLINLTYPIASPKTISLVCNRMGFSLFLMTAELFLLFMSL